MWALLSLDSLEVLRPHLTAVLTTLGLMALRRLLPVFEHILERPPALQVAYDLSLAGLMVFTLSFFFAGLGYV
jgi:hypothetical protein